MTNISSQKPHDRNPTANILWQTSSQNKTHCNKYFTTNIPWQNTLPQISHNKHPMTNTSWQNTLPQISHNKHAMINIISEQNTLPQISHSKHPSTNASWQNTLPQISYNKYLTNTSWQNTLPHISHNKYPMTNTSWQNTLQLPTPHLHQWTLQILCWTWTGWTPCRPMCGRTLTWCWLRWTALEGCPAPCHWRRRSRFPSAGCSLPWTLHSARTLESLGKGCKMTGWLSRGNQAGCCLG